MSSGSRSGYARRISSWVIPSATIPTTVATGIRSPRMHGTPPICFASTVMRLNFIGGLCRRSFYPVPSVAAAQLDQLGVLEVAVHAADRDVEEARHAVEKAEAEDVELEKAHHRRHQDVEEAGAAPELVRLARRERGVAVLPLEVRREVVRGVVQQVALQRAGRYGVQYFFVDQVVAPARVHAVEETRAPVGVALAVRQPPPEKAVAARHAVHRRHR